MARTKGSNVSYCKLAVQTDKFYTNIDNFEVTANTNYVGVYLKPMDNNTHSIIENLDIYAKMLFSSFGAVANGMPKYFSQSDVKIGNTFSISTRKNERVSWNGNVGFDDIIIYYTRGNDETTEEWFCTLDTIGGIAEQCVKNVTDLIEKADTDTFLKRIKNMWGIFNPTLRKFGLELTINPENSQLILRGCKPVNPIDKYICPYEEGELYDFAGIDENIYSILRIAIDIAKRKPHFPCVIVDFRYDYETVSEFLTPLSKFLGKNSILFVLGYNNKCGCTSTISLPMI